MSITGPDVQSTLNISRHPYELKRLSIKQTVFFQRYNRYKYTEQLHTPSLRRSLQEQTERTVSTERSHSLPNSQGNVKTRYKFWKYIESTTRVHL